MEVLRVDQPHYLGAAFQSQVDTTWIVRNRMQLPILK